MVTHVQTIIKHAKRKLNCSVNSYSYIYRYLLTVRHQSSLVPRCQRNADLANTLSPALTPPPRLKPHISTYMEPDSANAEWRQGSQAPTSTAL